MELNSRINWTPGMELNAQMFTMAEQQLDQRGQLALRIALGTRQMGLLPGAEISCSGYFVGDTYEIERLQCLALLPSGRIVNVDEKVVVPVPMLFGNQYYLTVAIGDEMVEFEREGVPCLRPKYVYAIHTLDEAEAADVMPLIKFNVNAGVFSVDADYIPPCLEIDEVPCIADYIDKYTQIIEKLATHQNLEEGDGKRMLLRYLFLLKGYGTRHSSQELIGLTQEIAQAIAYFIVEPNEPNPVSIPQPRKADIRLWLNWVEEYLNGAAAILDRVVLEDNTIDYDALLAQAKKELYEELHPELLEKLIQQTKEELHLEIQQLTDQLTTLVRDTLKKELSEQFETEIDDRSAKFNQQLTENMEKMEQDLSKSLHDKLFSDIYLGVYNVLHEEEEEHFIPLI